MTDLISQIPYAPFGALYGSGLGLLTTYPQAAGVYWSYPGANGLKPIIGKELKSAINDAGMELKRIGVPAPPLTPGSPGYTQNSLHDQGNAATIDAWNRVKAEYGWRPAIQRCRCQGPSRKTPIGSPTEKPLTRI